MNDIKEGFFERIEYSVGLIKDNFKDIMLPLFVYNFITQIIIGSIISIIFFKTIDISGLLADPDTAFLSMWTSSEFIISIVIGIVLLLVYLMVLIPFTFATLHAIKNAYHKKQNDLGNNILYGFSNFMRFLRLYWHIFAYVALIPCLIIIFGGLLNLAGLIYNLDSLVITGWTVNGVGFLVLLFLLIYRGTKASFSLYHGVEKNDFERDEFYNGVKLTDGKWWRVFGNIFFFGIIAGFLISMVGGIVNLFFIAGSFSGFEDLLGNSVTSGEEISSEEINQMIGEFTQFSLMSKIQATIILLLKTFQATIVMVFIYVFYQRLIIEGSLGSTQETSTQAQL